MDMLRTNHAEMVAALIKKPDQILDEMTPEKANLTHMVMGISGEAGELLDAVKKHVMYDKPLDLVNIVEEIGDIQFYLRGLMDQLGITDEQVLNHNIEKLTTRYPKGTFTNKDAQLRADKHDI